MKTVFKITRAEYVKDYILRLTFSNGEVRTVDFIPLMQKVSAASCKMWIISAILRLTHLLLIGTMK